MKHYNIIIKGALIIQFRLKCLVWRNFLKNIDKTIFNSKLKCSNLTQWEFKRWHPGVIGVMKHQNVWNMIDFRVDFSKLFVFRIMKTNIFELKIMKCNTFHGSTTTFTVSWKSSISKFNYTPLPSVLIQILGIHSNIFNYSLFT